jgi:hypothetical protein
MYGTVYALSGGGLYRFHAGSTLGTLVVTHSEGSYGFEFDSIGNVYITGYYTGTIEKHTLANAGCGT